MQQHRKPGKRKEYAIVLSVYLKAKTAKEAESLVRRLPALLEEEAKRSKAFDIGYTGHRAVAKLL